MMISTKGFFFPCLTTGQLIYDAVAMCHTLGFSTYSEIENANFRGGSYLLSESDQHYLMISGYLEDYYTDPVEAWADRTVAEQLIALAPRHDTLYEFNLILLDAKPDSGSALMTRYIDIMTNACSMLFDLNDEGEKSTISFDLKDN